MLVLSKKIYYALEAVLYIAYNAKTEPLAGNAVAEAQNLPTRYLEPMMQKLVRAGILRGVRGPAGGYMLGRERRNITLADICAVIGNEAALPASGTRLGKAVLAPASKRLIKTMNAELAAITLAQLCDGAEQARVSPSHTLTNDFII